MRLNDDFIAHEADGEQVLIDTAGKFAGLVRNNRTAAFIVDCLKTDTTKEQIVDAMTAKYDAPKDVIERDVEAVLEKLKKVGAIAE